MIEDYSFSFINEARDAFLASYTQAQIIYQEKAPGVADYLDHLGGALQFLIPVIPATLIALGLIARTKRIENDLTAKLIRNLEDEERESS